MSIDQLNHHEFRAFHGVLKLMHAALIRAGPNAGVSCE
jgi:hypothetical protein